MAPTPRSAPPADGFRRSTAAGLVLLVLGTILALVGPASPASALHLEVNGVESIDDYAGYPENAGLPEGCSAAGLLTDVQFTHNGDAVGSDMQDQFDALPGDVIGMSWADWAEGCGAVVSLAVKAAQAPVFEYDVDQALLDFYACAPGDALPASCFDAETGRYQMSITMPANICNYQLDAVVGPPLDVVGPSGSYYGPSRNDGLPSMLISANNGGPGTCQPAAVAAPECSATGASIEVTNTDPLNEIDVVVLKDGVEADSGALAASTSGTFDVPANPGDPAFQITVVVNGAEPAVYDAPFTNDCTGAELPEVAVDCQAGTIVVTTSSTGPQPVTFAVTATAGGQPVAVTPGPDGTFTTTPNDTLATTISVSTTNLPGDADPFFTQDVPPCTEPVAAVQVECQAGTVTVTTTQPTGYEVTFAVAATVAGQPVEVTDNGDGTFTVAAGREAVQVVVTADEDVVFSGTVPACDEPVADATVDCETGGITVTTTQPDDHVVAFVVTANGTPLTAGPDGTYAVAGGSTPVEVVVTADGVEVLRETIQPCDEPTADATVTCSGTDTITVTTTQPDDHTVDFLVTADGEALVLDGGKATTTIGSTNVTIVVTADGAEIHREVLTPCTEVEGVQQGRTPGQLPRTGGDLGLLALAAGMILSGFGLVVGADRRLGLLLQKL